MKLCRPHAVKQTGKFSLSHKLIYDDEAVRLEEFFA